tara:strand:- start:875 stop:1285 length:411 start_codon:yes stop_codon:yes gene_type:complete
MNTRSKAYNQVHELLLADLREELSLMRDVYRCRTELLVALLSQASAQTTDLTELEQILYEARTFQSQTHEMFLTDREEAVALLENMREVIGGENTQADIQRRASQTATRKVFWKYCAGRCRELYESSKRRLTEYRW